MRYVWAEAWGTLENYRQKEFCEHAHLISSETGLFLVTLQVMPHFSRTSTQGTLLYPPVVGVPLPDRHFSGLTGHTYLLGQTDSQQTAECTPDDWGYSGCHASGHP